MRLPDSRPVLAATLLATLALTACSSSGGDKTPSPTTKPSTSPSSSTNPALALPLLVQKVTAKQNTAVNKIVPLLPGVQNTSYDGSSKTLEVFLRKDVTAAERAVVISQLRKDTGRTAVTDSETGTTTAPMKPTSPSPTATKTSPTTMKTS